MEIVRDCAVQMTMYKTYLKFKVPKLFKLADRGDWDEIPARVRSHPKECRFRHKYAPGDTALHRLVRPLEQQQVESTSETSSTTSSHDAEELQFNPQDGESTTTAVTAEEEEVSLPAVRTFLLSSAENDDDIEDDSSEARVMTELLLPAIRAILIAYPAAATVPSQTFGQTPLHLACRCAWTPSRLQVVELLLKATPKTRRMLHDKRGRTPLHYLVESYNNAAVGSTFDKALVGVQKLEQLIQDFCQGDPKELRIPDEDGQTVLALLCQQPTNKLSAERQSLLNRLEESFAQR